MEQMIIRNLPDGTKARIRRRAAEHNRSMEAEARSMLEAALAQKAESLVDLIGTHDDHIDFVPERMRLGTRDVEF